MEGFLFFIKIAMIHLVILIVGQHMIIGVLPTDKTLIKSEISQSSTK